MDQIFEELDRSFERNDFKESQRRVALIRFIGECYNYRVLRTNTLFDILYRLVNINWNMDYITNDKYFGEEQEST